MRKTKLAATIAALFAVSLPALAGIGVADEAVFQTMAANEVMVMSAVPSRVTDSDVGNVNIDQQGIGFVESMSDRSTITTLTSGNRNEEFSTPTTFNYTLSTIDFHGTGCGGPSGVIPNLKNMSFQPTNATLWTSMAASGNTGSFINDRDGTIEFNGGASSGVYSFEALAKGSGSVATLKNESNGTLLIQGNGSQSAIHYGSDDNAQAILENSGAGFVLIKGSDTGTGAGIACLARSGTFMLQNTGTGQVSIQGGSKGVGVDSGTSISKLNFINASSGTLEFLGGTGYQAHGIKNLLYDGGGVVFTNQGRGRIVIKGGSGDESSGIWNLGISTADGGSVDIAIQNLASGSISILGGEGTKSYGVARLCGQTEYDETPWTIENASAKGTIEIVGGKGAGAHGIDCLATGSRRLDLLNRGTLKIEGGQGAGAFGIRALGLWNSSYIYNYSGGKLTISAGIGEGAHGIDQMNDEHAGVTIFNKEGAVMALLGNASANAYAINSINDKTIAPYTNYLALENSGLLQMNSYAIGSFGKYNPNSSKLFVNTSTGKIETEVGALFEGGSITETVMPGSVANTVVLPDGSVKNVVSEGVGEDITVFESSGTWMLKADWVSMAQFDDGGTIIFTNLNEGTDAANDIKAKFQAVFGKGTTIQFAPAVSGGSGSGSLDSSSINDVLASNDGAVFFDKDFSASGTLSISDQGDLRGSTGFQKLVGADRVEIGAGKKFTLLGDGSNVTSALINLVADASLDLGSAADAVKGSVTQGGALGAIQGAGAVNIRHGHFTSTSMSGSNAVSIAAGASLVANAIESGAVQALGRFASASTLTSRGGIHVDTAGSVRGTTVKIEGGDLTNKGVTSADKLDVQGNVMNTGIVDAKEFKAPTGEYVSAGTEIYQSFKNQGVLVLTNASNMIIGDLARTGYLLSHLDVARKLLEAGSELPTEVTDALAAQGLDVAAIAAQALAVGTPEGSEDAEATSETDTAQNEADTASDEETIVVEEPLQRAAAPEPAVRPTFATWHGALTSTALLHATQDAYALEQQAAIPSTGAWATILHDRSEFDIYESDRDGIRVGLQGSTDAFTAGVALSYADGSIEFDHERDSDAFSGALYGSYRIGSAFVAGTASYGRERLKDEEKLSADVLAASLKAGASFEMAPGMQVIPHAGVRILRVKTDETDTAQIVQYPLGVSMEGRLEAAGWQLSPRADVSFVWNTGDRKVDVRDVQSVVAGSHMMQASFGLAAQKGAWTVGLDYVGAFGSDNTRSHSLNLKAVLTF